MRFSSLFVCVLRAVEEVDDDDDDMDAFGDDDSGRQGRHGSTSPVSATSGSTKVVQNGTNRLLVVLQPLLLDT